jgi:hypothetical protein
MGWRVLRRAAGSPAPALLLLLCAAVASTASSTDLQTVEARLVQQ